MIEIIAGVSIATIGYVLYHYFYLPLKYIFGVKNV